VVKTNRHIDTFKRKQKIGILQLAVVRGLIRGMAMAILPQGNQEPLVVKDKVGRPKVSLG